MAKVTGENLSDCAGESDPGNMDGNFYFTHKGLAVLENDGGYFGDSLSCRASGSTPAIIPWKRLKPFLKLDQTLLRSEVK